ncbi:erythroid differentiation-related factor 1-like [Elysia marginata]|uniref:Erythroid differentiation-related factor 1-like n=1 Tax=Elysia marginata TaxID=1093978 RepID=A0AAV4HYW3_9GAST|nr:erythroid differentiation-related factor 1-like [Elysia marginata]
MADLNPTSDIKSTAVVKYSSVKWPLQFSTIRLNTDLNHPPTDQTRSRVYFDRSMPTASNFSKFLSINMAHSYQDLVGQVDVISSSKSIKALLKMPFSSSPHISIMVHRLGKTLLLEEFDVFKHIIRKQAEEWSWLRNYFYDVIAKEEKEKQSPKFLDGGPANRESILNDMYMNLIRHSFAASENGEACTAVATPETSGPLKSFEQSPAQDLKGFHHQTLWKFQDISMLIDSDLPIFGGGSSRRPCISLRLRDSRKPPISILTGLDYWLDNLMSNVPEVAMCYHINGFVQKYEVIKTEDIPNLENSSFDPNEVLDIAQNIMSFIKCNAAKQGHTYWFYKSENDEMVKLYDLTDLCKDKKEAEENPFTVPVGLLCHRVAGNLRTSGQRRNADSKAMFENCLRLLDDTKYCQECADAHFHLSDMWVPDKSINDVWHEKRRISDPPSDLYDEDATESDDSSKEDQQPDIPNKHAESEPIIIKSDTVESSNEKEVRNSVAFKELVVRGMVRKKAWQTVQASPIAGTTDERCRKALSHIRKGLNCIDKDMMREKSEGDLVKQESPNPAEAIPLPYAPLNVNTKDRHQKEKETWSEEQELQMNSPWKAIPLPYKSKDEANVSESNSKASVHVNPGIEETARAENKSENKSSPSGCTLPGQTKTSTANKGQETSWHGQTKFWLLRKASITYFVLAKEFFEIKKYGHTLRHVRYAMHCFEALEHLDANLFKEMKDGELYMMLLYLAAQARACLYPNLCAARHDFEELGEEEAAILHSAQAVLATPKMSWIYEWSPNLQTNFKTAFHLYEKVTLLPAVAKKSKLFQATLKKDFAACVMNLGVIQMDICKDKILKNKERLEAAEPFIDKAMNSFKRAMKLFDAVGEKNTSNHNCSNIAYMHTLAAAAIHNHLPADVILSAEEKEHLMKSIGWLQKQAKGYKGQGMDQHRARAYQNICSQYYEMAKQYFVKDSDSITDEDVINMKDYLQKSLKHCCLDSQEPFLKKNRTIAANANLSLAKVCEMEWHKSNNITRRKHLKQKSVDYYQKSIEIYKQLKWPRCEMCAVISWISGVLQEAERGSVAPSAKKKLYRYSLCLACDLAQALDTLVSGQADEGDESPLFKTDEKTIVAFVDSLNKSYSSIFRLGISNEQLKNLYQCSLALTVLNGRVDLVVSASMLPICCSTLDCLRDAIRQRPGLLRRNLVLQQVNTAPHSAKLTQQWLQHYGWDILPHPAHSPYCALSDFYSSGPLKLKTCIDLHGDYVEK